MVNGHCGLHAAFLGLYSNRVRGLVCRLTRVLGLTIWPEFLGLLFDSLQSPEDVTANGGLKARPWWALGD